MIIKNICTNNIQPLSIKQQVKAQSDKTEYIIAKYSATEFWIYTVINSLRTVYNPCSLTVRRSSKLREFYSELVYEQRTLYIQEAVHQRACF